MMRAAFLALLAVFISTMPAAAALNCTPKAGASNELKNKGLCKFDAATASFAGTPSEQARCLLRPVKKQGNLGDALQSLPQPLEDLVGKPVAFSKPDLRAFLQAASIAEKDIGGSLDKPLSRGKTTAGRATPARYFVIHDTSTPNCSQKNACAVQNQFPANMNQPDWSHNKTFNGHKGAANPVAHMITNRVGASFTMLELSEPIRAVKFESCVAAAAANKRGLFIHVENVQPRLSDPLPAAGQNPRNDATAPTPGFTDPQYERLALIYIAASSRRGDWLIPALHAPLDSAYRDGHDDPQNFALESFAKAVETLLGKIKRNP
jgi:hypothetical protein